MNRRQSRLHVRTHPNPVAYTLYKGNRHFSANTTFRFQSRSCPMKWFSYSEVLDTPSTSIVLLTEQEHENKGVCINVFQNIGKDEALSRWHHKGPTMPVRR